MERLTEKHYLGTDHYMKCSGSCNVDMDCIDCPSFDCLVERLAAYEDTGLEPESVEALKLSMTGKAISEITEFDGLPIDRLRELAEADKDGRLVVLPCKVGDGLWAFCSHPVEQVYSFTVTDISTLNGRTMLNTSRCGVIDARDVGKTVFLTREEAEKALEAWKDG
jgi:hypothetical protein